MAHLDEAEAISDPIQVQRKPNSDAAYAFYSLSLFFGGVGELDLVVVHAKKNTVKKFCLV